MLKQPIRFQMCGGPSSGPRFGDSESKIHTSLGILVLHLLRLRNDVIRISAATAKSFRMSTRATANSKQPQSKQKATIKQPESNQHLAKYPTTYSTIYSTKYATATSMRRSNTPNNQKVSRKQPESNQKAIPCWPNTPQHITQHIPQHIP
jgi:hypothetical protein